MLPLAYHIETYSSENLFGKNDIVLLMLQEYKHHRWLEEALFAIDPFLEASNIFQTARQLEKFLKFAMFLSYAGGYSHPTLQGGLLCNMTF